MNNSKPFYLSKTYISNLILASAFLLPEQYRGFAISPEIQTIAFAIMNLALRAVTKDKLTLT